MRFTGTGQRATAEKPANTYHQICSSAPAADRQLDYSTAVRICRTRAWRGLAAPVARPAVGHQPAGAAHGEGGRPDLRHRYTLGSCCSGPRSPHPHRTPDPCGSTAGWSPAGPGAPAGSTAAPCRTRPADHRPGSPPSAGPSPAGRSRRFAPTRPGRLPHLRGPGQPTYLGQPGGSLVGRHPTRLAVRDRCSRYCYPYRLRPAAIAVPRPGGATDRWLTTGARSAALP